LRLGVAGVVVFPFGAAHEYIPVALRRKTPVFHAPEREYDHPGAATERLRNLVAEEN
jgi:hypothetical protein